MRKLLAAVLLCLMAGAVNPALSAPALVASVGVQGVAGSCNTTASIDTTGATLLVAGVSSDSGNGTSKVVTDSKSNTWTRVGRYATGGSEQIEIYYSSPSSVGSSHTFTCNHAYGTIFVQAFSGITTSSPLDTFNGASGSGITSLQPGSVTPANSASLVVTALGIGGGQGTDAINSSYTITNDYALIGGTAYGGGMAWNTITGATNPTWSNWTSSTASAISAVFIPSGGGGATTVPMRSLLGVGQ